MRRADQRKAVSDSLDSRPEPVKSMCIACGGRNLVRHPQQPRQTLEQRELVLCRACGLVAPNANARKSQSGFQDDYAPLEGFKAHLMVNEILDAFTHEHVKRRLQSALEYAQGDVALICHRYLPVALDTFAHVVSKYGFTNSVEGVMESVRVLAALARDDAQLVQQLVCIRKVLTPTGAWVRDDAAADQDDLARKQLERDALHRQQDDAQRAEQLAAENARRARLRARKIALGLDPSEPRLPRLVDTPPLHFVTHADRSVRLRVNAQFATSFQWHLNGKPLAEDDALVQGVRRSALRITRLTKRAEGEYACVCTNEEGAQSTRGCRVAAVALRARRLVSRKLHGLASAPLAALGWKRAVVSCVANSVLLFHAGTFAAVKVLPALPSGEHQTLAWSALTKLLVTASSAAHRRNEIALYALDLVVDDASSATVGAASPPARTAPTAKSKPQSSASASDVAIAVSTGANSSASEGGGGASVISRALSTHQVDELSEIRALQIFAGGRLLLLSDMAHRVVVYALAPALRCQQRMDFRGRICHIASCTSEGMLAVAVRGEARVHFYHPQHLYQQPSTPALTTNSTPQSALVSEQLAFRYAVNCSAFDAHGFVLAVAESSCLRAWISIVNVRTRRLPSRTRFEAHVGKVSCLQWTRASALLLSSGFDGYVKIWDVQAAACVLALHLDDRGVHSFSLVMACDASGGGGGGTRDTCASFDGSNSAESSGVESDAVVLALGYSECRLQSRAIPQLRAFEASRCAEMHAHAATIQSHWKGRKTRELIRKYIRE